MYFATRGTDWAAVATVLQGAHFGWSLAVVVVSLACHVLRAERWRVLLRPVGVIPRGPAISATLVGFGASSVLPLRLGEVVRPVLLARRVGIPTAAAISSIVLERIFDVLLVMCCFLVVAAVYDVPASMRVAAVPLGGVVLVAFVVLMLMARYPARAERLIRLVLARLPSRIGDGLWSIVDGLLRGLSGLADGRTIALVLGYSIVLWSMITVTYLCAFLALDIDVPLVVASLTTVVIVAAAVFLPQAPGFIGTWQLGCTVALGIFHVPKDVAIGYSFLTWVIQIVVNVGAATVALALQDVSVRQLAREVEQVETGSASGG